MKEKFTAFTEKHARLWELVKFVFTACSTTVLYYVIFWLGQFLVFKSLETMSVNSAVLHFLGFDKNMALALSYLSASFLSYVASYIMNRKVTFKSNSNVLVSTILFALMVVVTTAFTAWFGTTVTSWLVATKGISTKGIVASLVIPTLAMLIPFVWTFPFQKYVIYKNKPEESEQATEPEAEAQESEETEQA